MSFYVALDLLWNKKGYKMGYPYDIFSPDWKNLKLKSDAKI